VGNTAILNQLATTVWERQKRAAKLAVQAEIMHILLATRNLDFAGREFHCEEAVRFGQLSGNGDLLAIARDWYGNTYTVCYHQPDDALPILNNALAEMNSDSSQLVRSAIHGNLSIAYAKKGDETKAMGHIKIAHESMPSHPELEPSYQYIRWNQSELDALEGKSYLHLAEHSPSSEYAQKAYDVLVASTSKQSVGQDSMSGSLIKKADAARALGDMRHFIESLSQVLPLLGSKRRIVDAIDVTQHIPDGWQHETAVQKLQQDLDHLNNTLIVTQ
jgi:hypothetical protein